MIKGINHIGIAVNDLDESINTFSNIFGDVTIHNEVVETQKVRIASFDIGNVKIELTQATDSDSPIAKFIEKRGQGIHHIAFESDDISNDLNKIGSSGVELINKIPQAGAHDMQIAFLHPKSTNGVLIELCQENKGVK